jgi:polyvinyl alcohol dehydrogenase (cytochrome)
MMNGGAVLAINLNDGSIAWTMQGYPSEGYNSSCFTPEQVNCPVEFKGRFGLDVGASPLLLRNTEGKEIIVASQKTGDVWGLDPDNNGKILWRRRVTSADNNLQGVFGMAADGTTVFTSVFDEKKNPQKESYWGIEELGIYALDGFTGEALWSAPVSKHCGEKARCRGYSAALTTMPGVLFAAAKDGYLRAFASESGELLWEFNTAQEFTALNGEIARGGDIDGPGAVVANGMIFINSGYATGNAPIRGGNAFLAFSIDGK